MKHGKTLLGSLLGGVMMAGCIVVPDHPRVPDGSQRPVTEVARLTGERQCERGGETLLYQQRRLEAVGVPVLASTCGNDGRMYTAVCGGATGHLGIFTIPAGRTQAAEAAGFVPLSAYPDAQRTVCR